MSENKTMKIGLNVSYSRVLSDSPSVILPTDDYQNIDFVVCHLDPNRDNYTEALQIAGAIAKKFSEKGVTYIPNFEFQNFSRTSGCKDGYDWANREDGTHLLKIPDDYIEALKSAGNIDYLMYDEFEHIIINRNASIELASKGKIKLNAFPLCKSNEITEQGEYLSKQIYDYNKEYTDRGIKALIGEHVFPVLYHTFARNGIIPNFKSQKESYSNIQFMIAAGAALEYNTPLSNCVDCWFRMTNPGHSATEMYNNLLFAYLAGVNRVYVESSSVMEKDGKMTEHGAKFKEFADEYKNKSRDYDISDYKPEIGIINYDDTYWGQNGVILWKNMLFGNKNIKPNKKSKEYVKAINLITHGETCINGISWGRVSPWSIRKHRSFATMNNAVLFDDRVTKEKLASLKLCFLCGNHISECTLKDIYELVNATGLTVVTSKRFLPEHIKSNVAYNEINDGKGKWIVVDSFRNRKLKKAVKPFIGNKSEIRLKFNDNVITLKISDDGNEIRQI